MVNNLAWSIDPNAFLKSIYNKNITCLVSLESSSAAMIVCSCLEVHLSYLNPS
jgi:hypothetical protein